MRTLAIEARSRESAEGLRGALVAFDVELIENADGKIVVQVPLGGGSAEIVAVLNAIQQYVEQDREPAVIEMDGRSYLMDAT
jgi:hypothetical protein